MSERISALDIDESKALHTEEQHKEAERAYRQALAAEPDHAAACCGLGTLLCGTGRSDEGLRLLHRAVELRPRDRSFAAASPPGWTGRGTPIRQSHS